MNNHIRQYKFLFAFSWILFYLIFPTWALPISVTARAAVFFGFILFFSISAYIMNNWFFTLPVDKPIIIPPKNVTAHIKNNALLFSICCVAVILHIYPIFLPILIIGDEVLHLLAGLWLYKHIDVGWHSFFQILFWTIIILGFIVGRTKKGKEFCLKVSNYVSELVSNNSLKLLFILLSVLVAYFILFRNIPYYPQFIRYPHVVKIFYHIVYSALGITHVGPRILQLVFSLISAVYLYRTILLFSNKESALLGATIYLFLPVLFAYAQLAEISCGTLFFTSLISFYFLRFINQGDNRDLLLTSFFIGTGFMYKREVLLMFIICTIYLVVRSIVNRDFNFKNHLKILLISLVPIMPWMIIGKFYNWRNYKIVWSNLVPFEGKVFSFFMHIPLDISWILFILFVFSVVYILIFKRNTLSLFFGLLFVTYYFFLAMDIANYSPRLAMTYYPAIAVYIALFLSAIINKVKWKHFFKAVYLVLVVYLIIICTVPSINAQYLSSLEFKKLQYYPADDAMKWVRENVKEGEKILNLNLFSYAFYREKFGIDRKIITFMHSDEFSSPDELKTFYREQNMSYIMFPYNQTYVETSRPWLNMWEYLRNNPDNEYIEVGKYIFDEYYIYIYQLKEN